MLKTIKTTKEMRLDELIKHVWDNDVKTDMVFRSNEGVSIRFVDGGRMRGENCLLSQIEKYYKFTVEVEEEITGDRVFPVMVTIHENGRIKQHWNKTINNLRAGFYDAVQIHAVINGRLELLWERDSDD